MQVKLTPNPDGTWDVYCRKTRPPEGHSRTERDVPPEKLNETVETMVKEMRPWEQVPLPSF